MTPRSSEHGMVLVNVLLMVALASSILVLMAVAQDASLDRSTRLRDAATADAAIRGGELSAITALRRDAARPELADTLSEAWAQIGDQSVPIEGGRFKLAIADAQGKLNLNGLALNDVPTYQAFASIVPVLDLPADLAPRVISFLKTGGPISSLNQLQLAGIAPALIARLATVCTVLPGVTQVNVNTAPEPLLAALVGDPVAGRLLVSRRARQGYLDAPDFALASVPPPAVAGFASGLFWVRTRVTLHGLARERTTLLFRERARTGITVRAIGRWNGLAAPPEAPLLQTK